MKNILSVVITCSLLLLLNRCFYGVNKETSEIGILNSTCLDDSAWENLTSKYSIQLIEDSIFSKGLIDVRNHFIKPAYILYFNEEPKEIIGCDYYSVRVVYNPSLSEMVLSGLSPSLSDDEQIRIRNRVQQALTEFQCEKGKLESKEWMSRPAPYGKENN